MKKSLLILLSAALFAACVGKPVATIEGTVTGMADGVSIYLIDPEGVKIDSTAVADGKFRFEITTVYPDRYGLQVDRGRPSPFFIEPGTILVSIDGGATPVVPVFSGTPSNDGLAELNAGAAPFNERMQAMMPTLVASQETPSFDSLYAIYTAIGEEREQFANNLVLSKADTPFAAYYMYSNAHSLMTPEAVDSVLNIVAAAPANAFTDALKERRDLLAASAVGQKAPDFTQAQPNGEPLSLSSLKGQLVLIDFWASWCGPCRRENPNVVKLYDRFHDKGFEILGVSLDDNREDWLEAIEADGLKWKHVSDVQGWNNAVAKLYAVRSIPHTVLVGPDGVIIAKNLRGAELEAKVAEVLGE
jgi:peroxiredoxin